MSARILSFGVLLLASACGGTEGEATIDAAPVVMDASTVARVQGTITYAGAAQGGLVLAAFTSFPPMGGPVGFAQQASPSFPATLTIDGLPPGTLYVLALLDVAPASPTEPGPEDRTAWQMNVTATAGEVATFALTLRDP